MLVGLNNLQSGIHKQYMKDLFVELCLTVPVRLRLVLALAIVFEYVISCIKEMKARYFLIFFLSRTASHVYFLLILNLE